MIRPADAPTRPRVLYMAHHLAGAACLRYLAAQDVHMHVITHRIRPEEEVFYERLEEIAEEMNLPWRFWEDIEAPERCNFVRDFSPDIILSVCFRDMIPERILRLARSAALNMHPAYLPKYRGRCPVNWAIINDEKFTGVTLHHMVRRADAGDIVGQTRVSIDPRETALSLHLKLAVQAAVLLQDYWPLVVNGNAPRAPQDESEATCYGGRRPEDGLIDWNRPVRSVDCLVRAVTHPYPGAFTFWRAHRLFIWEALPLEEETPAQSVPGSVVDSDSDRLIVQCRPGQLEILRCQLDQESETTGAEFARQYSPAVFGNER